MIEPYYQDNHIRIYNQDCRQMVELPDNSAQCVVTSPPYWGLRKYSGEQELIWGDNHCEHKFDIPTAPRRQRSENDCPDKTTISAKSLGSYYNTEGGNTCSLCGAWKGAYGLEPTPEMYVQHTIEILREIRRVLRKDGVVFFNIGDSYAAGKGTCFNPGGGKGSYSGHGNRKDAGAYPLDRGNISMLRASRLKPKDLCLIPFRLTIAAQEDGWWVRSVIIWSKPNPMPESVTDRPTESHEYILLLTKNSRYYWDADAVRVPLAEGSWERAQRSELDAHSESRIRNKGTGEHGRANPAGRNIRSVWEFNEDDEQGGKVYRVLQGCPIHSPLLHPDILKTLQDGEPQDCLLTHTLDRYSRLVPVLSFSLLSKLYHTNGGVHLSSLGFHHHGTECGQTLESIGDNRMLSLCCPDGGHKYGHQKVNHTKHIQKADGSPFCSSDYSVQSDELIATLRSKEIRKTVSLTVTNDSVFLLCPDRIAHTLQSLGCICSYNYYNISHFPLQDVWTFSTQPFKDAHFAVFPEKLPEICIKAATPEVGCCSKCGAPWERITERVDKGWDGSKYGENAVTASGGAKSGGTAQSTLGSSHGQLVGSQKTLGWQPTCKCNADKTPSLVLDPFMGAGTTLWVAKKLNRQAVGYEISEEYCHLALERNRQQALNLGATAK